MELIDQHTKKIMEQCKKKSQEAGLQFDSSTLEYIVTNRDLIELGPKVMIPSLYDYWVHDLQVIAGQKIYEVYPNNPYETVINTRPAISFYNDNNPDWLNAMIFYHVLGHIDFFQNNSFFKHTRSEDFCGKALSDKREIEKIRQQLGERKRWVDYVIEFARAIDNLVGYYAELKELNREESQGSDRIQYYFGDFLKNIFEEQGINHNQYLDKVARCNHLQKELGIEAGEKTFLKEVEKEYSEFEALFERYKREQKAKPGDVFQHILENSPFLNLRQNKDAWWMKKVIQIIRDTSLYFQPQIRTKIFNEGWASYWHQHLFIKDSLIEGHRDTYAKVNSGVMVMPRVGLNPYALSFKLLEYIEESANAGKLSLEFQKIQGVEERRKFDRKTGAGKKILFDLRRNFNDSLLINYLSDDDFQDFVDRYRLFVAGKRINPERRTVEYYVKSRRGKDYRKMLNDSLYHPPHIIIEEEEQQTRSGGLYLNHVFEGKTLVKRFIPAVLTGLEYLCGGDKPKAICLETTEFEISEEDMWKMAMDSKYQPNYKKLRVVYTMKKKNLTRVVVNTEEKKK